MDSFNKVVSFVLGLVVVLVFLAVVTGKINLKGKPSSATASKTTGFFNFGGSTPTLTPTPTEEPLPTKEISLNNNNIYKKYNQTTKASTPKTIPSTGLPTLFIPTLLSGLAGGNFLRKVGKKKA